MAAHVVTSDTSGVMENCIVRCIDIMKTEIRDYTLHYVEIQSSTIINSKLYNCTILNSSVKSSELVDTILHESDFEKSKLTGCNITRSPLAFRRFPPELIPEIFKYCVELEDGKVPALLAALRTEREFYLEAVYLFSKLNFYVLNENTMWRCGKLDKKAIRNIFNLKIE
jgi:uncharacterized protein YjbI with pentapeptide repeats